MSKYGEIVNNCTQDVANLDELKVLSRRVKMIRLAHSVFQTRMAEEMMPYGIKKEDYEKNSIELEDALNILKLLKAVNVKGL